LALIAAMDGVPWLEVDPKDKERARALVDALRRERGRGPTTRNRAVVRAKR
jgi:hypothetical protein